MRLKIWKAIKNLFSGVPYMGFLEPDKNITIVDIEDSFDNTYLCFVFSITTQKYGYAIYRDNQIIFIMFNYSGDNEYDEIVRRTVRTKYTEMKNE